MYIDKLTIAIAILIFMSTGIAIGNTSTEEDIQYIPIDVCNQQPNKNLSIGNTVYYLGYGGINSGQIQDIIYEVGGADSYLTDDLSADQIFKSHEELLNSLQE